MVSQSSIGATWIQRKEERHIRNSGSTCFSPSLLEHLIDWIALDKGQRTVNETVNMLMLTMEEYINYGLSVLAEKLKEDEGYFYNKNSFLDIFKGLTRPKQEKDDESEEAPESLD